MPRRKLLPAPKAGKDDAEVEEKRLRRLWLDLLAAGDATWALLYTGGRSDRGGENEELRGRCLRAFATERSLLRTELLGAALLEAVIAVTDRPEAEAALTAAFFAQVKGRLATFIRDVRHFAPAFETLASQWAEDRAWYHARAPAAAPAVELAVASLSDLACQSTATLLTLGRYDAADVANIAAFVRSRRPFPKLLEPEEKPIVRVANELKRDAVNMATQLGGRLRETLAENDDPEPEGRRGTDEAADETCGAPAASPPRADDSTTPDARPPRGLVGGAAGARMVLFDILHANEALAKR